MPGILIGHKVYDFVDPDISQRLEQLVRERGMHQEQRADDFEMDGDPEKQEALAEIRKKKKQAHSAVQNEEEHCREPTNCAQKMRQRRTVHIRGNAETAINLGT